MRRVWVGVVALGVVALVMWVVLRARPAADSGAGGQTTLPTPSSESESSRVEPAAAPSAQPAGRGPGVERRTVRDRKRRDEMREKIYRAFGRPPPSPNVRRGAPPGSTPITAPPQTLDKKYIQDRIREDFVPLAKECYEAALERDESLAGKMIIEFTIVGDGSVGGVVDSAKLLDESTLAESELSLCMRESMMSMSFEPPESGGMTTVRYPFVFRQDDANADAAP